MIEVFNRNKSAYVIGGTFFDRVSNQGMGKITLAKVIAGLESPAEVYDWPVAERPRRVPGITIRHYDALASRSEINAESSPATSSTPSLPAAYSHANAQQTLFAPPRQAAAPANESNQSLSCN